jgi:hypothetical protein
MDANLQLWTPPCANAYPARIEMPASRVAQRIQAAALLENHLRTLCPLVSGLEKVMGLPVQRVKIPSNLLRGPPLTSRDPGAFLSNCKNFALDYFHPIFNEFLIPRSASLV